MKFRPFRGVVSFYNFVYFVATPEFLLFLRHYQRNTGGPRPPDIVPRVYGGRKLAWDYYVLSSRALLIVVESCEPCMKQMSRQVLQKALPHGRMPFYSATECVSCCFWCQCIRNRVELFITPASDQTMYSNDMWNHETTKIVKHTSRNRLTCYD